MYAAVAELAVVQVCLLGTLTSQLGYTSHSLAVALALLNLILKHLGHILMDVQIVVDLLLDEVAYIFIDANATIGGHRERTEFDLGLTLEHRLLNINGNGRNDTCTDVAILIFAVELLNGTGDMFLESTLVSTTLSGVLAVNKRVILLAILIGMGKSNLDVVALKMHNRIKGIAGHTVFQQIFKSMT